MEERVIQSGAVAERPVRDPVGPEAGTAPGPADGPLDDARALTILTTEHWSLLATRSLVYNEAFARGAMYLTFLSATLVALGLVSTATGFSRDFLLIAAVVFGLDLFIGLATMGRVATATSEDLRYLQGMNRLRNAYHEIVPGLEPWFVTGRFDDIRGVFAVYGTNEIAKSRSGLLHGFTTTVGMIGVINAGVAGVLAGVLALLVTASGGIATVVGVATFALSVATSIVVMIRSISRFATTMTSNFPSPAGPPRDPTRPG
ncbi:MAG: hypothetical protein H0V87_01135 [Chloroflexi bacterium]|nr:hypothetical protein [Chloroflexota bacterium]